MSPRTCRRILWAAAAVAVPLPVLVFGPGLVPAARLAMLGALSLAIWLAESSRGAVVQVTAVLLGQAVVYLGLLWVAAHAAARLLAWLAPASLGRVTLAITVLGLGVAAACDGYRTPFAAQAPRASLLDVYR